MKSQDLVLLFKIHSLWSSERPLPALLRSDAWKGWETLAPSEVLQPDPKELSEVGYDEHRRSLFTVRQLAATTGISKSQVSLSLNRSLESGIAVVDRRTGLPKANGKALLGVIVHAVRYVFPARRGQVTRGIPTAMAAPVLRDQIVTAGEFVPVWPDPRGSIKGQAVEPLSEGVAQAVADDPLLYAMLSLADAMRIGQAREQSIAADLLREIMES
ncbi:hypothetical protein C1922_01315 [Stenotrophomonas sp. ZAC14D2_NAIMI4_7]|uniref:hypothetical protein n=1 Tax=Stenotrophomonas sp. ZAC14D2_NAIMI4_7 TaxID=2072405 RepID=UPI000D53C8F4|nr:hypothetical protein [Stenotrophomonas sp. ZAC14D2_NAIMI4_7]AWH16065.1 hypothetical protein C1922_01315 [Stenotrophomonas sp. ZAC14D2_NAIMI4_7]